MMRRRARGGLLGTAARTAVIAGTAQATAGAVARRQHAAAQAAAPGPAPVAETPPAPEIDTVTQLRQLAELRDQGILTEEEFSAKKAQILGI